MKLRIICFCTIFFVSIYLNGQGYNHTWLIGTNPGSIKGRILIDSASITVNTEQRDMTFKGTQGNISDENGNFLMASNGIWIMNANNTLMQNGDSLNPNAFTSNNQNGMPLTYANIILPYPGDTNKYVLFHHSATYNGWYYPANEIFYTVIDMTLDGGLGGVISKNNLAIQDTLNWGLAACRHANGRDWWIIAQKDSTDIVFKILFTPNGIQSVTNQQLNLPVAWGNVTQLTFSPNGKKFAYNTYHPNTLDAAILLLDFDRCNGIFSNPVIIPVTSSTYLWGLAFSSNSKLIYTTSSQNVYQVNTDTFNVQASLKLVASYDGFNSPFTWCCPTDFMFLYLAADGKIYITSGNAVQHHHIIHEPNLSGVACDVEQHALSTNGVSSFRSVPNHPNYYLGCDTTCTPCLIPPTSIDEVSHDFRFNVYPNPSSGNFNIIYLLPQNKEGKLEVFDIIGKVVFELRLPQWSTLQNISLPSFISNGLYNCVITSDNNRISKKIAIVRD